MPFGDAARRFAMHISGRFPKGTGLATVASFLALLMAVRHDWIELVFGLDPDSRSGLIELGLVVVPVLIAVASATVPYRNWKRLREAY
jgi:hypothetical protein